MSNLELAREDRGGEGAKDEPAHRHGPDREPFCSGARGTPGESVSSLEGKAPRIEGGSRAVRPQAQPTGDAEGRLGVVGEGT